MGQTYESETALEAQVAYRKYYDCLLNLTYPSNVFEMGFNQEKIKQKVTREQGDIIGMYQYAILKYADKASDIESDNLDSCESQRNYL